MNITILLKLLFAHIFADFVLQTNRICDGKKAAGKTRYIYLLLHSLIHAATAYLLVARWDAWIIPSVIFSTHFAMDYIKSTYMKENMVSFIIDQVVHIAVIIVLWLCLLGRDADWGTAFSGIWDGNKVGIVVTAYMVALKPTSVLLNLFIKQWMPHDSKNDDTLPHARLWIGYLERFLILTFIFTHNFEGIGFLLAAKSIFRFGELNKAKEIKITEYVLIGTLASFAIATGIGFFALQIL